MSVLNYIGSQKNRHTRNQEYVLSKAVQVWELWPLLYPPPKGATLVEIFMLELKVLGKFIA
jgi:hypothetical protein